MVPTFFTLLFIFRSLSRDCYDRFIAKLEDACREMGDFNSFFVFFCHKYEDLPSVL
jgi:hypothetical protein